MPVTATFTSSSDASAATSGASALNRAAARLEDTTTDSRLPSEAVIASARLNDRKSISGIRPEHPERQHDQPRHGSGDWRLSGIGQPHGGTNLPRHHRPHQGSDRVTRLPLAR